MKFIETDGGRKAAGFVGTTGDCVTRALTIATGEPYKQVYQELFDIAKEYSKTQSTPTARSIARRGATPRRGVHKEVYDIFLKKRGWGYLPRTNKQGRAEVTLHECTFDPAKTYIVSVRRHLTVIKGGTLLDSYDPTDGEKKNVGVKGYYLRKV
jgi:hypothetical protein